MFIYALLCPETECVRYVGKSNNPKRRTRDHLKELKQAEEIGSYNHRQAWLKSLRIKGLKPVTVILESVTEANWEDREKYWIRFYLQLGCKLTNGTDGGGGGLNPSLLTRQKMSFHKKGKPLSAEHKRRMSNSHKLRYQDPAEREKTSLHSREINARPEIKKLKSEQMKRRWQDEDIRNTTSLAISKAKQKYAYALIHEDGRTELVANLRLWCNENGYKKESMGKVARGLRASCHGIKVTRTLIEK